MVAEPITCRHVMLLSPSRGTGCLGFCITHTKTAQAQCIVSIAPYNSSALASPLSRVSYLALGTAALRHSQKSKHKSKGPTIEAISPSIYPRLLPCPLSKVYYLGQESRSRGTGALGHSQYSNTAAQGRKLSHKSLRKQALLAPCRRCTTCEQRRLPSLDALLTVVYDSFTCMLYAL